MKFKYLVIISSFLLINQLQSADVNQQPLPTELPPAYLTTVISDQPAPQIITIERTITVCPECKCTTEGVLRVCTCLATPVILPVALIAGAVHGTFCGLPYVCAEIRKKSKEKQNEGLACCACCCCPCICTVATVGGMVEGAIKFPTKVINFIVHGTQGS